MQDIPPAAIHYIISAPTIFSAIIKLPVDPGKDSLYHELPCNEQDTNNVIEIITTVGNDSKVTLLFNQTYLKGIGARIQHVHPLKLLEIALSTDDYKACLGRIMDDYFKKSAFMEGLSGNLNREKDKGKLEKNIPAFAERVKISKESIQPYFYNRDWEGLVRCLLF